MLAHERQQVILTRVAAQGSAKVTDLCAALGVSDMTVRRDLTELVEQGLVERVHGGVKPPRAATLNEPGFLTKSTQALAEKRAIAVAAARLVHPDTCVGISGGTTTYALATALLTVPRLTVVTNSLPVAEKFYDSGRADQTILLTGGQRTPSMALVGPLTVSSLETLRLDVLFLGTHGFDLDSGLTCPNLLEAQTNQAMVAAANRVVVLADHSKWGVRALARTIPMSAINILITDSGIESSIEAMLRETVDDLIIAETVPTPDPPTMERPPR